MLHAERYDKDDVYDQEGEPCFRASKLVTPHLPPCSAEHVPHYSSPSQEQPHNSDERIRRVVL